MWMVVSPVIVMLVFASAVVHDETRLRIMTLNAECLVFTGDKKEEVSGGLT